MTLPVKINLLKCNKHENFHIPSCIDCFIAIKKQRRILLEFVKQLADESVYESYENLNEMNWDAHELLKEIDEI